MIKDLRGRHSSTEPELGWEVSLWIPGTAGNLLAKLLIFNEYNLFCIFYRKERNISRPSIRVASVCVCVLSPWHQPGRPKKLSAASLASDSWPWRRVCLCMACGYFPSPAPQTTKASRWEGPDSVAGQRHPKTPGLFAFIQPNLTTASICLSWKPSKIMPTSHVGEN